LIFYYINDVKDVSLMVDISQHYEVKHRSLSAYRSQFDPVAEGSDRVATPLNQRYLQNVEARDRLLAGARLWSYAEGFAIKRPFGIDTFL
jgi:LmbE family N-acetylglucosaminyl deacetylase